MWLQDGVSDSIPLRHLTGAGCWTSFDSESSYIGGLGRETLGSAHVLEISLAIKPVGSGRIFVDTGLQAKHALRTKRKAGETASYLKP
jgi:hypothetical protein